MIVQFVTINDAGRLVSTGSWTKALHVPRLGDFISSESREGVRQVRQVFEVTWISSMEVHIMVGKPTAAPTETIRG